MPASVEILQVCIGSCALALLHCTENCRFTIHVAPARWYVSSLLLVAEAQSFLLSERAEAEEGSDSEADDDNSKAAAASKGKHSQAASKVNGKGSRKGSGKGGSTRGARKGSAGGKSRVASASDGVNTPDGGDVKKGAFLLKSSKKKAYASPAPKDKKRKLQAILASYLPSLFSLFPPDPATHDLFP